MQEVTNQVGLRLPSVTWTLSVGDHNCSKRNCRHSSFYLP